MANKKITELPFIHTITGSQVFDNPTQNTVVPVVMYGTTNQITVENYAKFINLYNAHTGSAGNTFAGPQTINNNVTISGNTSIGGTLVVAGKITAQEFFTEITSASIIFESGSTIFGNSGDDTHTFTGSIILNGSTIGAGELNAQTASQDSVNYRNSTVTSSLNFSTASLNFTSGALNIASGSYNRFYQATASIHSTTSSLNQATSSLNFASGALNIATGSYNRFYDMTSSVHFTTQSLNVQTGSQELINVQNSTVTSSLNFASASINFTTGALNSFTGSVIGQSNTISTFTSSVNFATQSLNTQTGSQNSLNTSLGLITSSIYGEITSFNSVFQRVSSTTGSMNTQSGSQDLVNLGISSVTGSLIGITNGLMAFTAALDSTYATDAQLYQLYQATSSIHSTTQSLNVQTGSQDLVNRGISSVTGSINTTTSSFNSVFSQIGSTTSSLIGITNGLMAFTAALDSTYATDAQLYQLYQATASIHFTTSSLNVQTGSQDLVNLGISSVTGSLIGITNGLMAFTAALDSTYATDAQLYQLYQATASIHFTTSSLNIQTGSQDLVNLSISTFTGSQNVINSSVDSHILKQSTQTGSQDLVNLGISTFTGSLRSEVDLIEAYTASLKSALTISGNDVTFAGKITAQEFTTVYTTSSILYQSGSTKFGNSSDDTHEFTGSKFEVFNSNASGTMYAVVKNNRSRNAAVKTTTTNGSFIAGTSIGTDAFQYQIYDEVEGTNRVTINSQGGTTLQGAVTASQTIKVNAGFVGSQTTSTSGYVNETKTIADFTTSYFLNKNSADGEGSSATTFNLTGLPAIDGTIIDVVLIVQKDATVASINTSAIFNINGSDPGINTVFASGTAAVTTIKTFRVGRFNGVWRIVGAVGTY